MALHALFAVVLAIVALTAAQEDVVSQPDPYDPHYQEDAYRPDSYAPDDKPDYYERDHASDYKPGVYAPDPYAPDQYVLIAPEGAVDTSPPVNPYEPDVHGPVGYGYGNDQLKQLKQKVQLRIADQKAKIDSITEWRHLTLIGIEKISTLTMAWCRSKLDLHMILAIVSRYCVGSSVFLTLIYLRQRRRYMFCPRARVCLSICLSVCNITQKRDLNEILRVERCRDMDKLINF